MFRPIKHKHLPTRALRRNQVRVLGHIPRPIYLFRMQNLLRNLDSRLLGLGGEGVATELSPFVVIGGAVESVGGVAFAVGEVHCRDLEVVLRLTGSVCA